MSSGLEYRDRERQRKRERRRQASQAQRERERQRAIERRRNCTDEQREREKERDRECAAGLHEIRVNTIITQAYHILRCSSRKLSSKARIA